MTLTRVSAETVKAVINPADFYRAALPDMRGKPNAKGWVLTVCPLHSDSNPSLSVNLKHGGFYCFGCRQKGDLIRFHSLLCRLSFKDTIADLARRYLLNPGD